MDGNDDYVNDYRKKLQYILNIRGILEVNQNCIC